MSLLSFYNILNAEIALQQSFEHKSLEDKEQFDYIMELIKEEIKSGKGSFKVDIDSISNLNKRHLLNLGYKITVGGTISW